MQPHKIERTLFKIDFFIKNHLFLSKNQDGSFFSI